jgi:uncharacterized protein (TIGR03437 family)
MALLGSVPTLLAQQYLISTQAGGAPPPTPASALFSSIGVPTGVALDGAGNIYFGSFSCIFRVDPAGLMVRVAGNGRPGFSGDGGPAINAQIGFQSGGLVVDAQGNIFISDGDRVRRISPEGGIDTVVGIGQSGYSGDGGPATAARLWNPGGLALDRQGNLLIAENGRVRKVSPSGIITTIAGDGSGYYSGDGRPALSAGMSPGALAVDGQGNLFIADSARIRKVAPSGIISTIAGTGERGYSGDGGPATNAEIWGGAIGFDATGNLFLSDLDRIRKISPSGTITTIAGNGKQTVDGVPASSAQVAALGLAVNPMGVVFFSDLNCRVRRISLNGIISTVAGNGISGFSGDGLVATRSQVIPYAVAADQLGNLFIADLANNRIRKISRDGVITTIAGNGTLGDSGDGGPGTSAQLNRPAGVASDTQGNVFIADTNNSRIRRLSPNGTITTIAGTGTVGFSGDGGLAVRATLAGPSGVAVDRAGNIFFSDTGNNRLRRISPSGIITTIAGNGTHEDSGDGGAASAAGLNQPCGIALDDRGNIWIAQPFSQKVRKIAASGIINTFAGSGDFGYSGDGGPAVSARLYSPYGVAVDPQGTVFIADTYNFRIRSVSQTGEISTIAGTGTRGYSGDDGPATAGDMDWTLGVAVGQQGNLHVAAGNAIRVLQPLSTRIWVGAVVDGASQRIQPLSPGKIVVIYGAGLGPATLTKGQAAGGAYPKQLAGTAVLFNGIAGPLLYTSATQVAAIVPYGVTDSQVSIAVSYQELVSVPVRLPLTPTAPSLFTIDQSGVGQAAAINAQIGTVNSAANPVKVGNYISLFATGEGQTTPFGVDGKIADFTPLRTPIGKVTVTIDEIPAEVQYAGAAPGLVSGLMQVNVKIPDGVRQYRVVPVVLQVGSSSTPTFGAAWIVIGGVE